MAEIRCPGQVTIKGSYEYKIIRRQPSLESDIQELFSESGSVSSVHIALDRDSGRKRGFAFVEMETEDGAKEAISALNNHSISGRQIFVDHCKDKSRSRN